MTLVLRPLQKGDYSKDFLKVLSGLTVVGDISKKDFEKKFDQISKNPNHITYVGEKDGKIACTASLIIEEKFTHNLSRVGHIEDVVVDADKRGDGYGKQIINKLIDIAREKNCYKVILDCNDKNVKFYESVGFKRAENQMDYRL